MKTVTDVRMMTVKASNKDQDKALEEREREWHQTGASSAAWVITYSC